MTTGTAEAAAALATPARIPRKVWLTRTEECMLSDLAERGHISLSAAMRAAVLTAWEHTFQSGPGRRTG